MPLTRTIRPSAIVTALALATCSSPTSERPAPDDAVPCLAAEAACAAQFAAAPGRAIPIYRTHDLSRPDTAIRRLLVMIHGTNRNHDAYFETAVESARQAGLLHSTLVVAPRFRTSEDAPEAGAPYWSSGGWKRGHLSSTEAGSPRISSYAVLDSLLAGVAGPAELYPNLESIVVAGHSAGGQVVHRFAAASALSGVRAGVAVRFVVANPSTYLYLGPERWDGASFSIPDVSACPDYQRWHYGLDELNSYMRERDESAVRARMRGRDIRVLLGTADTLGASLDMTCGAMLQGVNRLDRGRHLVAYMDYAIPEHRHRLTEVPGVGHSSRGMFTSDAGLDATFR